MIEFTRGNLLQANVEALVNTVNTVGVMGKGIALQFKEKFPENFKLYKKVAEENKILIGKMFIVPTNRMDGIKWIINFPTKKHWRHPSKIEYVVSGLDNLVTVINEYGIKSLALPPLGCGNGGLEWNVVKPLIIEKLRPLKDVQILIFEPSEIAYAQTKQISKPKPKLTPTRALILYLMRNYSQLEYSLTVLETQKLVYFLNRLGDEELSKVQFDKHLYGPYAAVLNHVLYDIDGFYINGMKFKDVKNFDPLTVIEKEYGQVEEFINSHATNTQRKRIDVVLTLIEGFETPLSMEVLSTVDYVINYEVTDRNDLSEIISKVYAWNDRKKEIIPEDFIKVAHKRLIQFKKHLYRA